MTQSADQLIRKAKRFAKAGDASQAAALYQAVLEKFPNNARAQAGLSAMQQTLQVKSEAANAPPPAELQNLAALCAAGRSDVAIDRALELAKRFPRSFQLFNFLGVNYANGDRFAEAVESFNHALSIKPDYLEALWNLGNLYQRLGDEANCVALCERAVSLSPDNADALTNLGNALVYFGRDEEALPSYVKARKLLPKSEITHFNYARALILCGRSKDAIPVLEKSLAIKPNFVEALDRLGCALAEAGRQEEAVEAFSKAVEIRPDFAIAHNNLGYYFQKAGRYDEALASCVKATECAPDFAEAHNNLGAIYRDLGLREKAAESFERAIAVRPNYVRAYLNLTTVKDFASGNREVESMQALLAGEALSSFERSELHFSLGKARDDLGDYAQAFEQFAQGNRLRKERTDYSTDTDRAQFARIRDVYGSIPESGEALDEASGPTPVFIVGMPRSGTSLVEQILASHSLVHGGGELSALETAIMANGGLNPGLSPSNVGRIGRDYRQDLGKLAADARYVTDKLPLNFRWIGFIRRAIPDAKIIWVERDARAVCWSLFRRPFANIGHGFADDLDDLTAFYALYKELMAFWMREFPDDIYRVDYERLTERQEEETKNLLEHIGLGWEDACLEFHKTERAVATASSIQVKQKMYRGSSEEWRNYEAFLQPMIKALSETREA